MFAAEQTSRVAAISSSTIMLGLAAAASGEFDASVSTDESTWAGDAFVAGAAEVPRVARVHSGSLGKAIFADISPMSAKSSSSGGARSSGGSSSIGGASGGGDGPKRKKEMTAGAVHTNLLALHMKRAPSLLREEFDYLLERGFIETINPYVYDCQERETLRIEFIGDDIQDGFARYAVLDRQLIDLSNKLKSRWHIFWSYVFNVGSGGLKDEEIRLAKVKGERKALAGNIEKVQTEYKELIKTKKYLGSFVPTQFGLVRLSDEGARILKVLLELKDHAGKIPMSEFEARVAEFRAAKERGEG